MRIAGSSPGHEAGPHSHDHRKGEDVPVQTDVEVRRPCQGKLEFPEPGHQPVGERKPHTGAHDCEHHRLTVDDPDQPRATPAQSQTNTDLTPPAHPPDEHEVRQIDGSHEQHEADDTHQENHCGNQGTTILGSYKLDRKHMDATVVIPDAVCIGVVLDQAGGQLVHRGLGGLGCYIRGQPSHHSQRVILSPC